MQLKPYHRFWRKKPVMSQSVALEREILEFQTQSSAMIEARDLKIIHLQADAARKGLRTSGYLVRAVLDEDTRLVRGLISLRLKLRREYGQLDRALFADDFLAEIESELATTISGTFRARLDLMQRRSAAFGGTIPLDELDSREKQLKSELTVEVRKVALDRNLHRTLSLDRPSNVIVNVNSTVGVLNLDSIIGDVTTSVNTLSETGNAELALAIKGLTDAINNDSAMEEFRTEAIETMSILAEEANRDPATRRLKIVKRSLEELKSWIPVATQVATAWEKWGPTVSQFFNL